jgi:hypothetical protein
LFGPADPVGTEGLFSPVDPTGTAGVTEPLSLADPSGMGLVDLIFSTAGSLTCTESVVMVEVMLAALL